MTKECDGLEVPLLEKDLGLSLVNALQGTQASEIPSDIVDAISQVPILNTLKKFRDAGKRVSDYFYAKKVWRCLQITSQIPAEKRESQLAKMLVVPGERERFGESLLNSLERLDDERKATITGHLATALMREEVTLLEFWRMCRAVETLSLDEEWRILLVLEEYRSTYYTGRNPKDENWDFEGAFIEMVNDQLKTKYSDGDLHSVVARVSQTGLFMLHGWRNGPPHDCDFAPWYFTLKKYMSFS